MKVLLMIFIPIIIVCAILWVVLDKKDSDISNDMDNQGLL